MKKRRRIARKRWVAGAAMAGLLLGTGLAPGSAWAREAGPQSNGTAVTSYDWVVTPAGKQVTLGDFPMGGALSRDGRYLVVSNDGQGTQSLQVIDLAQQKVIQTIPYKSPEALYLGVAFSPDGKTLYASAGGNNKIRVFQFRDGQLSEQSPIALIGLTPGPKASNQKGNAYPAGLTVSPDGGFLYVVNNLYNTVVKIDTSTGKVVAQGNVGQYPYTALLSQDGKTLYVTNWGEDTVTALDPDTLQTRATIEVGLHPNALALNPRTGAIYVANSDSDTLSVIDPSRQKVVQTISLAPYRGALPGSQPDALTVSPDGRTLYVANAGNNDIAVVDLGNGSPTARADVKGLIPTGWYPTGVYTADRGNQILVLNAKGLGAGPNTQGQYIGNMISGTLSIIDAPNPGELRRYTEQVKRNNQPASGPESGGRPGNGSTDRFPIPRFLGQDSPIKHVIYVIKENRTYDQVFGDMGKGNSDPSLTEFGEDITPNLHKLANQFVLLDNTYTDAEVSADGHNWSTAAEANDYVEKNWLANYSGRNRGYDFEGTNPATYPQNGFIWNDATKSGVSFRDYGEFVEKDPKTGKWAPTDPSIGQNYDPDYPGWDLNISDLTRFDRWNEEFQQYVKNGNLPQFEIVRLPNDHTMGTKPGALTPQAYVAQNDYALGKLVDAVSHSPYWKNTAIFVIEDDSQDGLDHVDAHRTEALVISPYTQRGGAVDSTFYDTASMLKTIELILGMKPMTQYDAAALPMINAFTTHPDFAPYDAVPPTYPLDARNGQNAPMAMVSEQMDWSQEDVASPKKLDEVLWAATHPGQPYPKKSEADGGPNAATGSAGAAEAAD
ncbi:bifunctional YncE family protein/alkaline phosphatase family protein [Kyrpidia tusciae]|uniref:phospholipase C n=1 Tax=Kyrpidia tusciae (strain DSM 2912 / NBRC 15312 / T2) TaxID=562970 RepID=D5WTX1_KYRT2|nr:bifunctional YncE family protein/alkaline phosphatase family protein [Kyrpidia tusciae]ADG05291.1 40-residue YVTN family beta-propeller repeat protein [Kyrpidia tusciae DSM 2912]